MKAISTVSGGVMFIPDELEVKTRKSKSPISYKDLVSGEEKPAISTKILNGITNVAKRLTGERVA